MLLNPLRRVLSDRGLIFVGGKGGVGKTTIAGALAATASDAGRRTLVVSTDPAHSLGDVFGVKIGGAERRLAEHLWGLEIDPDAEAEAHIGRVKQEMKALVHPRMYGEVERQLDFALLAPGTAEAALLERMADLMALAGGQWDLLIFDTAPTGHTLRLLSLPEIMSAWADGLLQHQDRSDKLSSMLRRFGGASRAGDDLSLIQTPADHDEGPRTARLRELLLARQAKLRRARVLLLDPATTAFVLVLNPDRLSILESRKAVQSLARAQVPVAVAIVNRVLTEQEGGDFLQARRHQEAAYLVEIEREFAALPRLIVPLQAEDVHGLTALRQLGVTIIS